MMSMILLPPNRVYNGLKTYRVHKCWPGSVKPIEWSRQWTTSCVYIFSARTPCKLLPNLFFLNEQVIIIKKKSYSPRGGFTRENRADLARESALTLFKRGIKPNEITSNLQLKTLISNSKLCSSIVEEDELRRLTRDFESEKTFNRKNPWATASSRAAFTARASATRGEATWERFEDRCSTETWGRERPSLVHCFLSWGPRLHLWSKHIQ